MTSEWQFDARRMLPKGVSEYPEGAARFLEDLYRASLQPEERRELVCKCVLVPKDSAVPYMVRYADRPEASVQRLRKLGPTINPAENYLVVVAGTPVRIGGICSKGVAEFILPRYAPQPSPLRAAVRGRGHVRVDHDSSTVIFAVDRYRTPSPTPADLMFCVSETVISGLVAHVEPTVARLARDYDATHVRSDDPIKGALSFVMQTILGLVSALRASQQREPASLAGVGCKKTLPLPREGGGPEVGRSEPAVLKVVCMAEHGSILAF